MGLYGSQYDYIIHVALTTILHVSLIASYQPLLVATELPGYIYVEVNWSKQEVYQMVYMAPHLEYKLKALQSSITFSCVRLQNPELTELPGYIYICRSKLE